MIDGDDGGMLAPGGTGNTALSRVIQEGKATVVDEAPMLDQ